MATVEICPRRSMNQRRNELVYALLRNQFSQIVIDNFDWTHKDGSPLSDVGLTSRHIETPLFRNGGACIFYSPSIGWNALPATPLGDFNVYFEPTAWQVLGYNFSEPFSEANAAYIRNNLAAAPSFDIVNFYAEEIADVQRTIDTQLFLHKTTYLVKSSNKDALSKKNILAKKADNELAVFVTDAVSADDFELLPTPTPYIIDKLYDYKQKLNSEFLSLFGYNSNPAEKGERLIVPEVNANNEITENGYAGAMLQMRLNACEKLNALGFPGGITCRLHRKPKPKSDSEPDTGENEGGEDNG